ncbi:MAG TPA: hypothetical protein VIK93_08360 [Limnochordales bacterium]
MEHRELVQVVDLDDYTEPAAEPGYYAIYLRLSRTPSARWRTRFEEEWRRIPTGFKRPVTVVQDRLRLEIHGDDMVREQVDFAVALVARTNAALAAEDRGHGESGEKGEDS